LSELSRRLEEAAEADDFEQCAEIEAEIQRRQAGAAGAQAAEPRAVTIAGPHFEDLRRRLAAAVAEEEFEVAAELEAEIAKLSA
jgi:protein-arginine kinase activator protein McsA